jgi:hypothetical protein
MEITVKIKNVYGQEMIYPVCEKAQVFAKISNTKTFTKDTIQNIKALGYAIKVESPASL